MKAFAKTSLIWSTACLCFLVLGSPPAFADSRSDRRIDAIDRALQSGRIGLKTAVLRTAKLLFAPNRAPLEGEALGDDTPRLELFENVRRTFDTLAPADKAYLRSLSPDLARTIDEAESDHQARDPSPSERRPSTFDRVTTAYDRGELTLKEAVLLKAKLLFSPHLLSSPHPFSVQAGEVSADEPCRTGFYKDVHQVFGQLTDDEKEFLASLTPDLQLLIAMREDERGGRARASRVSALPNYPDLTQQEEGKYCIVHYTLNGTNAAPDKTYVELVRLYLDKAIKSGMTKHFTTAYAEGYDDFRGKLHVYLLDGPNAEWVDRNMVSGSARAGYITIGTKLGAASPDPDSWQVWLKGACFHEYFHGIQSAYNASSDIWFAEATAVWAQCYYGKTWQRLESIYSAPDSIFHQPNESLWRGGNRKYSMSAFAFFLSDKFGGYKIIKSYLDNAAAQKDAIKNLDQILAARDTVFAEEYIYFLASLYTKKISSIKKYMPSIKFETIHNSYGIGTTQGQVFLTGANFYAFDPEAGAEPGSLVALFAPGATGVPKAVLVELKGKGPVPFFPHAGVPTAYVGEFGGKAKQVAMIVTDVDYAGRDSTLRSYNYRAIVPRVMIKDVDAESPIHSGESSLISIKYDLLGTYPGRPFPAFLKITEKGPGVADHASGETELPVGVDQILPLWFNTSTSTVGSYRFTFQLAVPPDSWLPIPQVKSKGKCSVQVEQPDAERAPLGGRQNTGVTRSDGATIARSARGGSR